MAVRAKMQCTGKVPYPGDSDIVDVKFSAVYGENGEANAEWSKWTPCGELHMQITNPEAHAQFEEGKEYFVDITPAQ